MTLFEYLAIAVSLVLSFTAMRLVAGLPSATQLDRRYWVHLIQVLANLGVTVNWFWIFWSYSDAAWTLPKFWLVLGIPGSMYFIACSLIPERPDEVRDWRDLYYLVRWRLFGGITVLALIVTLSATVVLEMPWSHPMRLGHAVSTLVGVTGLAFENPRVHSGIAALSSSVYL